MRLSCLIAFTANWQVNDEMIRMIVAGRMTLSVPVSVHRLNGLRIDSKAIGGQRLTPSTSMKLARRLK